MLDIIIVPVSLLCYVISVVVTLIFCNWFFDRPEEWPYLIPFITSFISFGMACGLAEEKFSSKSGAKITAFLIAVFWIIFVVADIAGAVDDVISVLAGKYPDHDALDVIMFYVDVLLNSKIFAVVSGFMAVTVINR